MKDIIEGETQPTAKREREPGMLDIYPSDGYIYIYGALTINVLLAFVYIPSFRVPTQGD